MIPYFYRDKEGREIGPFDLVTLSKFRMAGVLDGDTPVRTADSAEWKPCREVIANSPTISAAPITKEPIKKSSNGILIALIAIVIVVIIATRSRTQHATEGLGSEDWGNSGDIPVKKTTGDTTINPLDKEAVKQALDYWKLTKLGQSHYLHMINRSSDNMNKERTIYELRNVVAELRPNDINEADKLNGLEWRGTITLCAVSRTYCPQRARDPWSGRTEPPDKTWSEWREFSLGGQELLWKTNGKWSNSWDIRTTFKQVEWSDLPALGATPTLDTGTGEQHPVALPPVGGGESGVRPKIFPPDTVKSPVAATPSVWTGCWRVNNQIDLSFTQDSTSVRGTIKSSDGKTYPISASVNADRLDGSFAVQPDTRRRKQACSLNLKMSPEGNSFSGTMENRATGQSFDWTGRQVSKEP